MSVGLIGQTSLLGVVGKGLPFADMERFMTERIPGNLSLIPWASSVNVRKSQFPVFISLLISVHSALCGNKMVSLLINAAF